MRNARSHVRFRRWRRQAWERNLTDEDGPYIELMAGVFTGEAGVMESMRMRKRGGWSQRACGLLGTACVVVRCQARAPTGASAVAPLPHRPTCLRQTTSPTSLS